MPAPPADPDAPGAAALLAAVNAARVAHGRRELAVDPGLTYIAGLWSEMIARSGDLSHGDFGDRIKSVHPNAAVGENIATGYPTGAAVVAGWLGDRAHRDILLGAGWSKVGVGWSVDAAGRSWAVGDFEA